MDSYDVNRRRLCAELRALAIDLDDLDLPQMRDLMRDRALALLCLPADKLNYQNILYARDVMLDNVPGAIARGSKPWRLSPELYETIKRDAIDLCRIIAAYIPATEVGAVGDRVVIDIDDDVFDDDADEYWNNPPRNFSL
ncbi:hypothetical protein IJ103_00040 [Candidatus Saccharibacteria bacterium]|nr:hypothetical protein [Candidatus Saccharibacteria bacterium]